MIAAVASEVAVRRAKRGDAVRVGAASSQYVDCVSPLMPASAALNTCPCRITRASSIDNRIEESERADANDKTANASLVMG
jgi:hypothetical protein